MSMLPPSRPQQALAKTLAQIKAAGVSADEEINAVIASLTRSLR